LRATIAAFARALSLIPLTRTAVRREHDQDGRQVDDRSSLLEHVEQPGGLVVVGQRGLPELGRDLQVEDAQHF
jgi:hypothetical protein